MKRRKLQRKRRNRRSEDCLVSGNKWPQRRVLFSTLWCQFPRITQEDGASFAAEKNHMINGFVISHARAFTRRWRLSGKHLPPIRAIPGPGRVLVHATTTCRFASKADELE